MTQHALTCLALVPGCPPLRGTLLLAGPEPGLGLCEQGSLSFFGGWRLFTCAGSDMGPREVGAVGLLCILDRQAVESPVMQQDSALPA